MIRRIFIIILASILLVLPVSASTIRWVDFGVPYESLEYAMKKDIATFEQEKHISWIDILSLAACRTGGKCQLPSVKKAAQQLEQNSSPEELLGELYKYYNYYHESFSAALGGLLGSYAIMIDGEWKPQYGLKAFSPIAKTFPFSHYDDFGASRSYGYSRPHLGHDMMCAVGTPVIAVESGTVEIMGWNQYGGWRIGIRSFDKKSS